MNKLLIILAIIFCVPKLWGQFHPQFEFYSNYDISVLTGGVANSMDEAQCIEYTLKLYDLLKKGDLNEADAFIASLYVGLIGHNNNINLKSDAELETILIKVASLNDRQRIDLLKRLYDIENSCYIRYSTVDGEKINFLIEGTESESDDIQVDFGSPLISNVKLDDDGYVLKFADPISQIDSRLFSNNIKSIKLPRKCKLNYLDNETKDVSSLSIIEGSDVVSGRALVDKDGTMVAAATSGLREYQVPDGVCILGKDCFRNASIESVEIPPSVLSIRSGAFNGCTNLKEVRIFGDKMIDIDNLAFDLKSNNSLKIKVINKLVEQYENSYQLLKNNVEGF